MFRLYSALLMIAVGLICLVLAFLPRGVGPEGVDPRVGLQAKLEELVSPAHLEATAKERQRHAAEMESLATAVNVNDRITVALAMLGLLSLTVGGVLYRLDGGK